MSEKVLIIEDEPKISRVLSLELSHEGYTVGIAENGRDGLEKALAETWDVILLDIMLPELNGLEVLRRLRNSDESTPVIFLTARGSTPDIVSGLDMGANDYITKPFEIEQLLARIRACIRNKQKTASAPAVAQQLQIDDLNVNLATREVVREGKPIDLTPKEFELLTFLLEHKNDAVTREQIMNRVWGYDFIGDTNTVDVYIRYLRKKVDSPFSTSLIQTIRGVGYSIRERNT